MTLVVTKGDGSGTQTVKTLDDVVGTAGTANASPLTVQGIASMTPILATMQASTNVVGKVGIDQTTPGTTDSVTVATGQGAGATIGTTSGAAVITDANGTLQQYLRGLIKQWIAGTLVIGAGSNTIGGVVNIPTATATAPTAARIASAASTNATSVKASAGNLYRVFVANTTGAAKFMKFYNKASSPTVGSDTPVFTLAIPANGMITLGLDFPYAFSTGIAYAITGAVGDADTTATAANDVHGFLQYL
jgi:hypothetical protein